MACTVYTYENSVEKLLDESKEIMCRTLRMLSIKEMRMLSNDLTTRETYAVETWYIRHLLKDAREIFEDIDRAEEQGKLFNPIEYYIDRLDEIKREVGRVSIIDYDGWAESFKKAERKLREERFKERK